MNRLPLLAALLLSGCAAHMVGTHGDTVALSGLVSREKTSKGGVIRYLQNGPAAFRNARHADAERKMRKFCGGDYRVEAEGPRSKFGSAMPVGTKGITVEFDEYWYIAFECETRG